MTAFFDDVEIGDELALGRHVFTGEDIIRFAEKYDPQPFHLSEEGASKTHFGRLCASGWHTAAIFMKLWVETYEDEKQKVLAAGRTPARYGPSPGFEDLKWLKPVYARDELTYRQRVIGKTESRSRPEWGILHFELQAINQNGQLAFSFKGNVFLERRKA